MPKQEPGFHESAASRSCVVRADWVSEQKVAILTLRGVSLGPIEVVLVEEADPTAEGRNGSCRVNSVDANAGSDKSPQRH